MDAAGWTNEGVDALIPNSAQCLVECGLVRCEEVIPDGGVVEFINSLKSPAGVGSAIDL